MSSSPIPTSMLVCAPPGTACRAGTSSCLRERPHWPLLTCSAPRRARFPVEARTSQLGLLSIPGLAVRVDTVWLCGLPKIV
eukprot:scaffold11042_cov137-Isochrysis_galbana.AAC.9